MGVQSFMIQAPDVRVLNLLPLSLKEGRIG